jgi:hypothetical protein
VIREVDKKEKSEIAHVCEIPISNVNIAKKNQEYMLLNKRIWRINYSNDFAMVKSTNLKWMVIQQKRRLAKSQNCIEFRSSY